jgi:menaquinone-specific isochorismate synthase
MDWLATQHAQDWPQMLFWSNRTQSIQTAGLGAAWMHVSHTDNHPAELRSLLDALPPDIRVFGGMRFAEHTPAPQWRSFGSSGWLLPRWQVERHNAQSTLALHILLQPEDTRETLQNKLKELQTEAERIQWHATPGTPAHWEWELVEHKPTRPQWLKALSQAQEAFQKGTLEKVVLARESRFQRPHAMTPLALLRTLHKQTNDTFVFLFQFSHEAAFLGATPERLYYRSQQHIHSEALAGTRARGSTTEEDERLGQALLNSDKDRVEQALVSEQLVQHFGELCHDIQTEPVSLRKLTHIQHLCSKIDGSLQPGLSDMDILQLLHPTPAVGGRPTTQALQTIQELEPFDRGWYAAPIGWQSSQRSEFAVGIRSALTTPDAIYLYTGAGILSASESQAEWSEINDKLRPFLSMTGES